MIDSVNLNAPLGKSDHQILEFQVTFGNYGKLSNSEDSRLRMNYFKGDYDKINSKMAVIDWEPEFRHADIESAWQKLADKIHQISRDNITVSNFRHKHNNTPWMNADVLKAVRPKGTRWKKYKYCTTSLNMQRYNNSKYIASSKVREAKRRYEKKVAGNIKSNPKVFWKFARSKTKVKEEIPSLKDDKGYTETDNYRKAELLNTFFF